MVPGKSKTPSRNAFIWSAFAILLLGFAIRAIGLDGLPLYMDEASYMYRTHLAIGGNPFAGDNRKLLLYTLLSVFNPTGAEGPWVSRYVVGLYGLVTLAAVMGIARRLDSRRTALLAGGIYALLPFAVFHERNILADPVSATFVTVGIWLSVILIRRQSLWLAALTGICLAASYLTKNTSLFYLGMPLVAAFFLAESTKRRLVGFLLGGVSLLVTGGVLLRVYDYAAKRIGDGRTALTMLTRGPLGAAGGFKRTISLLSLQGEFQSYWAINRAYLGLGIIFLVLLSLVWIAVNRKRKEMLFMLAPAIIFALPVVVVPKVETGVLVPRILTLTVSSLAVLAALSFNQLLIFLRGKLAGRAVPIGGLVLILSVIPLVRFDYLLITRPTQAPLYISDKVNWVTGFLSGTGQVELSEAMVQAYRDGNGKRLGVMMPDWQPIRWIRAYLGPRTADIETTVYRSTVDMEQVAEWLADDRTVFFIHSADLRQRNPFGAQLELIGQYDPASYDYTLNLFKVIGAEGELASAIYAHDESIYDAGYLDAEYHSISALFLDGPADPIYVFPENAADGFAAATDRTILPLYLTKWPYELEQARQAVDAIEATHQGQFIEAVLISEFGNEASLLTGLAFIERYYSVFTQEIGPIKYRRMLIGPESPELAPHDAVFDQTASIQFAGVIDQTVKPGGFVRVALTWETSAPIAERMWMFCHVYSVDTGEFVAQYDSEPGAGLKPTQFWEPLTPVTDRFAISLPPDLPPGDYEIRVGLYHPETFERMQITEGTRVGPDYAVLGAFTIER